jgi:hypothetical protein
LIEMFLSMHAFYWLNKPSSCLVLILQNLQHHVLLINGNAFSYPGLHVLLLFIFSPLPCGVLEGGGGVPSCS